MNNEITTTDLSKFGYRELGMAGNLLTLYSNDPNNVNIGDNMQLMMNTNSGNVFLTDDDCNVVMIDDNGKLANFYNCPNCGHEGFAYDFLPRKYRDNSMRLTCPECKEKDIARI